MTGLRRHRLEDLHLRGLAPRTQPGDPEAVKHLAEHDRRAPDQISEEEIRPSLLSLINDKQVAASPCRIPPTGIRFLSPDPALAGQSRTHPPQTWSPVPPYREGSSPGRSPRSPLRPGAAHLDPSHSPTPKGAAICRPVFLRSSPVPIGAVMRPGGRGILPLVRAPLGHRPQESSSSPLLWPWC
jgi:hypothetical protein